MRVACFDEWAFELEGRYAGRCTLYARVHPSITARCNQLAYYTRGLPASTLACLAVEAVLIHVPAVSDHHKATHDAGADDVCSAGAEAIR